MRFLYQYPDVHGSEGDLLDVGSVAEVAVAAERAGWHGLSFTEHPVPSARWLEAGGHQALDPFVALGHAAAVTSRLRLVTFLAVAPYRNPMLLAKAAATVDKLSGGRLTLGLGAGYLKSEFAALGVDFEARNALFDEALEVLPLHWSGTPFSFEGRTFTARDVIALPRPVQDPIPIWIGGNSRAALRRVAGRAQGWMPMMAPPEVAATARTPPLTTNDELVAKIGELRDLAGERGDQLDVVASFGAVTRGDPEAAVERHGETLRRLEDAGVTWIIQAGTPGDAAGTLAFIEEFAATYIA